MAQQPYTEKKWTQLPNNPEPNAKYFILNPDGKTYSLYITTALGQALPMAAVNGVKKVIVTATSDFSQLAKKYLQNAQIIDVLVDDVPVRDDAGYVFNPDDGAGNGVLDFFGINGIYSGSRIKIVYSFGSTAGESMPADCECLSTDDVETIVQNALEWVEKSW